MNTGELQDEAVETPETDLDPFAEENLADPVPWQTRLREQAPVLRLTRYGAYVVTRHSDVKAVLRNWAEYESSSGTGLQNYRTEPSWRPRSLLLETDPPEHTHYRGAVNPLLLPRALQDLRPGFDTAAHALLDRLLPAGRVDVVTELAEPYVVQVFGDAVGIGPDGRENLLPYGHSIFNSFGPLNDLFRTTQAAAAGSTEWVLGRCQREALQPGGIGAGIWALTDDGTVTEQEAPLLVRSLFGAGLDSTVAGIAATVQCLAAHPDQWALLRADPGLARYAFEETLRYESPVQNIFRTTTRDLVLAGTRIPAGQKVMLLLASANADPRQYDAPLEYRIERRGHGQLDLGLGIHQCIGQHIARMEGEAVLRALAERVSAITLAGPGQRKLNNSLRGWASLPVDLTPA
ncbi:MULTISPECIES: cytochrome P450 [unclassified Geodermatophilus]|uniref:cytochrome P450 n=1 Tax=unclassified Geodermatophilus TaxID=2637632 RepID=UPI003EEE402D